MQLDGALPPPDYSCPGDAGLDLRSRVDVELAPAGGRACVPTGVAVALPEGSAGLVLPRSGLARHHGVGLLNSPGLIDSGYRDEISVVLINTDPRSPYQVRRGDRVAQLVVIPFTQVRLREVEELPQSTRGRGGFGHTGR